jgi:hypothetical protein
MWTNIETVNIFSVIKVLRNFVCLNITSLCHYVTQTLRTFPWVQQKANIIFEGIPNINISFVLAPYLRNFEHGMSVKETFIRTSRLDVGVTISPTKFSEYRSRIIHL